LEDGDKGEVAVALLVIQAIADHERIRDVKAGVPNRHFDLAAGALIEENTDVHIGWLVRQEVVPEVLEGEACVDNVFNDQHMLVGDAPGQVLGEADLARRHTWPDDTWRLP
jgi:hypothetical protein